MNKFKVSYLNRPTKKRVFMKECFPTEDIALKFCNYHKGIRKAMRVHRPDGTFVKIPGRNMKVHKEELQSRPELAYITETTFREYGKP